MSIGQQCGHFVPQCAGLRPCDHARPLYFDCTFGQWRGPRRHCNLTSMCAAGVNSRAIGLPTRLALALAASLTAVGPAAAQTHFVPSQAVLASELHASALADWNSPAFQFHPPDPLAVEATDWPGPSAMPDPLAASVQICETPFVQEFRVSIGSFLKGRVHISGFEAIFPMTNFLWGLYGPESESATSFGRATVPGLAEPANQSSFGFAISLSRRGGSAPGIGSQLLQRASHLAARGTR